MSGPPPALRARWVAIAGCAPSAHNTQPWLPRLTASGVLLAVDRSRTLPEADPAYEDLHLSLGCWLEALAIAARASGWELRMRSTEGSGPDLTVECAFVPADGPGDFSVAELRARRVDRGRLAAAERALEPALAEAAVLVPGTVITAVPEPLFSALRTQASTHVLSSPEMAEETLRWLRLDPHDTASDGLSAECLRLPRAVRVLAPLAGARTSPRTARLLARTQPLARTALTAVDDLGTVPGLRTLRSAAGRLHPPPTRIVLSTRADPVRPDSPAASAEVGLRQGRELLRLWLVLARHGLRVAVHSELKDCPDTRARLSGHLARRGQPDGPYAVFSVGRSVSDPPRSRRLPAPALTPGSDGGALSPDGA